MKKIRILLFVTLSALLLLLAGCGKTEAPLPPGATATPEPTAIPTATPTPIPTPIPYELVAADSMPAYSFAADYDQVSAALLAPDPAMPDSWEERFTRDGTVIPAMPEVSCLGDSAGNGDIIAAGESCLYILDNKDLVILALDGRENPVLSRTRVGIDWTGGESDNGTNVSGYEKSPLAIYPMGDIVAVVSDWYGYSGNAEALAYTEYTAVDFFRVSDPAAPAFLSSFGQDGVYKGSRLGDNGILTLVTDFTPSHTNAQQPEGLVPSVHSGGSSLPLAAQKVLLPESTDGNANGCSVLGIYSLTAPGQCDVVAVPGLAFEDIALMEDGPRFIRHRWAEGHSRDFFEGETEIREFAVTVCSDIYHLAGENGSLEVESVTVVNGRLPNASAMEWQNGKLWYAASFCQGLFTRDEQGGIFWRETMSGIRLGGQDMSTQEPFGMEIAERDGSIRWVGLLKDSAAYTTADGNSWLYLPGNTQAELLTDPITGGTILPWGEEEYMALYRTDDGAMTLSVRDEQLREMASRRFGSDHSNTLENRRCYFTDASANLLGFAADDSYCFYGFSEEQGLYFRADAFLKDWAWNARAILAGDRLIVADTEEVFLYDASSLELLTSYEL